MKHGNGNFEVAVRMFSEDLIEVVVSNSVELHEPISSQGYGSRVLDEITQSWKLEFQGTTARFVAHIALVQ